MESFERTGLVSLFDHTASRSQHIHSKLIQWHAFFIIMIRHHKLTQMSSTLYLTSPITLHSDLPGFLEQLYA